MEPNSVVTHNKTRQILRRTVESLANNIGLCAVLNKHV